MQVRAEQFQRHLNQQPLANCYLIFGDDPFLRQQQLDILRQTAREQGYLERVQFTQDKEFSWHDFLHAGQAQSLFSSQQLIELHLPDASPGREGAEALRQFAEQQTSEQILLVYGKQVNRTTQATKWFKTLVSKGVFVPVYTPDRQALGPYIQQRAQRHQVALTPDAVQLLALWYEGNLLALEQELMKLALQQTERHQPWQADELTAHLSDQSRYDVFTLRDTLLSGQLDAYFHCLERLAETGEEPVLILWTLAKLQQLLDQLAQCFGRQESPQGLFNRERIWSHQQAAYSRLAQQHSLALNHHLLHLIERAELAIKRGSADQVYVLFAHFGSALLLHADSASNTANLLPFAHAADYDQTN